MTSAAGASAARIGGDVELLADADRPGAWLLTVDRVAQSYVDLDDPTYLDFEYVQSFAAVLDVLAPGPLAVTHVGGGGCTVARYVAATRPGSSQIVIEPDTALTEVVRSRLPFPPRSGIRVRPAEGRAGVAGLRPGSADVVVLDAFHGGRVPAELTTTEFFADVARVLRPTGVLLANVADGPPLTYGRRVAATVRAQWPHVAVVGDPAVLKGRRFGNLVLVAAGSAEPITDLRQVAARAALPTAVLSTFGRGSAPLTDADPMRSPPPPEGRWRINPSAAG